MVSRLETSPTFMLGQECLDVSWRLNHPNSLSIDWWCFRDGLWIVTGSPYFSHGKKNRETSCRCSHQSIDPKHRRGHRISRPWCAAAPVNNACLICRKSEIFLRESNNDGNEDWWGYNGDVMIFTILLWYFMIRVWKCGIVPTFFYRQLRKMIIEHQIGDGLIPLKPQIWKEWTK